MRKIPLSRLGNLQTPSFPPAVAALFTVFPALNMEQGTSKNSPAPPASLLSISASITRAGVLAPHPSDAALRASTSSHHVAVDVKDGVHLSHIHLDDSDSYVFNPDLTVVSPTVNFDGERRGGRLFERSFDIFCALAVLIVTIPTTILSFGIPYSYYRCYRCKALQSSKTASGAEQEKLESELGTSDVEKWIKILRRLESQWKAFFAISAGALPAVFPMLAIYTVPKCSWASFLAALALFSGLVSMLMAKLSKYFSELYEGETMTMDWYQASRSSWLHYSAQRFWVVISLPTLWLSAQVAASTATIMLATWEQVTVISPEDVCTRSRLQLFRFFILFSLSMAVIHSAFFAFTVNSLIARA